MNYEIIITEKAKKDLSKLSASIRKLIIAKLRILEMI
jgi:mRNA-degrading endonuclease RelE of RelBE toxin-antitoxin system